MGIMIENYIPVVEEGNIDVQVTNVEYFVPASSIKERKEEEKREKDYAAITERWVEAVEELNREYKEGAERETAEYEEKLVATFKQREQEIADFITTYENARAAFLCELRDSNYYSHEDEFYIWHRMGLSGWSQLSPMQQRALADAKMAYIAECAESSNN